MNKIYFGHSKDWDYESCLYIPVRKSQLSNDFMLIFPHDPTGSDFVTERDIKDVSLFVAEISRPSTGLGIELGFAHLLNVPTLCIHQAGTSVRSSIQRLDCEIFEYRNIEEVVNFIYKRLQRSQH